MADQLKTAEEWLQSVLHYCGVSTAIHTALPETVVNQLHQFGGSWLVLDETLLSPQQVESFAKDDHRLLDALQYLMNATLNLGQDTAQKSAYTIEISGYREQRYLQLSQMAEAVASQVRQQGKAVEMLPLPASERRLIHTLLSEEPDLHTFSLGQEPERRLVVELKPQP